MQTRGRSSGNDERWEAAGNHFVWQCVAGVGVPFILASLVVALGKGLGETVSHRGLFAGGQLHLAVAGLLLTVLPSIQAGMVTKTRFKVMWQLLGLATILLMLSSTVVFAVLSSRSINLQGVAFDVGFQGGLSALVLATLSSYVFVWRAAR